MIPVLIVPVMDGWDAAQRMLDSIDLPIGRVIVVDNDQSGRQLVGAEHLRPLINLGFSGAINAAIAQTPEAPWWAWASHDLTFGTADWLNIATLVDVNTPRVVTGDRADERLLRFAYAAINRAALEAVGLLDEWTFYPIYYEDDDYQYRCQQGGVEWVEYNGQIAHERSSTIHNSPARTAANALTFPENGRRYIAKWGGSPGSERFSRPWDLPVPLDYIRPDIAGRSRRIWK